MLFAITYRPKESVTEESEKRSLGLFTSWTPPAGVEFKAHYATATGGGIAIVDVSSSLAVIEAFTPWGPHLDFQIEPCAEIAEAVPVVQKAQAWRDSVK